MRNVSHVPEHHAGHRALNELFRYGIWLPLEPADTCEHTDQAGYPEQERHAFDAGATPSMAPSPGFPATLFVVPYLLRCWPTQRTPATGSLLYRSVRRAPFGIDTGITGCRTGRRHRSYNSLQAEGTRGERKHKCAYHCISNIDPKRIREA